MNCPNCNDEMICGYIQSASAIVWGPQKHKIRIYANTDKGDVWIGKYNLSGVYKEAFRCPKCGSIIIPPI
jgi:predicted RNA-binding Zn-ribbon protein involved in translation (DUF1610 family)